MTRSKRAFDLVVANVLLVLLAVPLLAIALTILICDGRPILYVSERMRDPQQGFMLYKFRTMTVASENMGVSGGDKASRITSLGAILRRYRMDELPQLFNVIAGDLSFVGPRPPLRQYVERHPELYARVLKARPGITGLASIVYHRHEEMLLMRSTSIEETDAIYSRNCVPRKAALDLIYLKHRNLCMDIWLMIRTGLRF